jgi:ubiquinone/menaquinone biosynthesis C-methylase UbiE
MNLFSILQSPDDGTPIGPDLKSKSGIQYEQTSSGIYILNPKNNRLSTDIYSSPMFEKWNSIIEERIKYYTGKKTIAGIIANWSYRSIHRFNQRFKGEWLLDIGCGDGAHIVHLKDRSSYIGLDQNINRLEILKRHYPEATAIYGDAASLPLRSHSLNGVFSCNAFEHIWYLKDAVVEIHRCIIKNGKVVIVVPTEGGLWNIGRKILSKPHFQKKYPDIDFEFISHVEHCNEARQIIRNLETFFIIKKKYKPIRIPSVMLNLFIELYAYPKENVGKANLRSY